MKQEHVKNFRIHKGTYEQISNNTLDPNTDPLGIQENDLVIITDKGLPIPTSGDFNKFVTVNPRGEYVLASKVIQRSFVYTTVDELGNSVKYESSETDTDVIYTLTHIDNTATDIQFIDIGTNFWIIDKGVPDYWLARKEIVVPKGSTFSPLDFFQELETKVAPPIKDLTGSVLDNYEWTEGELVYCTEDGTNFKAGEYYYFDGEVRHVITEDTVDKKIAEAKPKMKDITSYFEIIEETAGVNEAEFTITKEHYDDLENDFKNGYDGAYLFAGDLIYKFGCISNDTYGSISLATMQAKNKTEGSGGTVSSFIEIIRDTLKGKIFIINNGVLDITRFIDFKTNTISQIGFNTIKEIVKTGYSVKFKLNLPNIQIDFYFDYKSSNFADETKAQNFIVLTSKVTVSVIYTVTLLIKEKSLDINTFALSDAFPFSEDKTILFASINSENFKETFFDVQISELTRTINLTPYINLTDKTITQEGYNIIDEKYILGGNPNFRIDIEGLALIFTIKVAYTAGTSSAFILEGTEFGVEYSSLFAKTYIFISSDLSVQQFATFGFLSASNGAGMENILEYEYILNGTKHNVDIPKKEYVDNIDLQSYIDFSNSTISQSGYDLIKNNFENNQNNNYKVNLGSGKYTLRFISLDSDGTIVLKSGGFNGSDSSTFNSDIIIKPDLTWALRTYDEVNNVDLMPYLDLSTFKISQEGYDLIKTNFDNNRNVGYKASINNQTSILHCSTINDADGKMILDCVSHNGLSIIYFSILIDPSNYLLNIKQFEVYGQDTAKMIYELADIDYVNEVVNNTVSATGVTPAEYFTFTSLSDNTYSIKAKNVTNIPANVRIPLMYNGKAVTSIGENAFYNCSNLITLSIPEGIKNIENNAFYNCSSLTNVTMPYSITKMVSTFQNCNSLTNVNLPNNMTNIKMNLFRECISLTSITIPSSVTLIEAYAFYGCTNLTNVTLLNNIQTIGGYAFYNCAKLTSITIPSSVTKLVGLVFDIGSTTNKATITFKGTVPPTIATNTFSTTKLNKIYVPVASIDAYKTATNWTTFADYIDADPSSIDKSYVDTAIANAITSKLGGSY